MPNSPRTQFQFVCAQAWGKQGVESLFKLCPQVGLVVSVKTHTPPGLYTQTGGREEGKHGTTRLSQSTLRPGLGHKHGRGGGTRTEREPLKACDTVRDDITRSYKEESEANTIFKITLSTH